MVANRKGENALAASCEDGVAEVGLDGFSFNSLAESVKLLCAEDGIGDCVLSVDDDR